MCHWPMIIVSINIVLFASKWILHFFGEVFDLCIGLQCRAEIVGSGLKAFIYSDFCNTCFVKL